ncbi:MFS transporter [Bordetella genomosp. 9]|uniref:MFS transporter n=1 Tax=Bordetella genomosp. 9 TaxID=1416803 RepID=A0A1W6Z0G5_9BORD|nr:MFS transporter [Bordetella genomosp. 9]ARP86867.1 MFS transporter [Bordetella genomosp. 9]
MTSPSTTRAAGQPRQEQAPAARLTRGTAGYRNANWALFAAGFSTFSLMYCVQPLLPLFADHFGISPTQSSLSLSLTTGLLALAIFIVGFWSSRLPRKPIMAVSLFASGVLTLAAALMPDWHALLAVRALQGLVLGGVPAVAMAYLAEEVAASDLGFAMGLYIGGSAFGGMAGRVMTGLVADHADWRVAMMTVGLLGIASAVLFVLSLPPSRHFTPQRGGGWRAARQGFAAHLADVNLLSLFALGFLLMGGFVTLYNYAGFRLMAPPYSLSQSLISAIFTVYLVGIFASALFGRLADRHGRGAMLCLGVGTMLAGTLLTLSPVLGVLVAGVVLATFGFFAAHSVASGWVGQLARGYKAQAASLYLLAYYLGSSVLGSVGGKCWEAAGWTGVAALIGAFLVLGLILAARLYRVAGAARNAQDKAGTGPAGASPAGATSQPCARPAWPHAESE